MIAPGKKTRGKKFGVWALILSLAYSATPAWAGHMLGVDDAGPLLTRPDGTVEDNGGVVGLMQHHSDMAAVRRRAYGARIEQNSPSLATSGFDALAVNASRLGAIYSDAPPFQIMPPNLVVFNQGVLYNKNAGIGLDAKGKPNTLAVVYASVLSNAVDSYFGNAGGLQPLATAAPIPRPLTPPIQLNVGFSAGAAIPSNMEGGNVYADTTAGRLGATQTGKTAGFAQKVNNFLYGALTASPLEIAGGNAAGGVAPGTPLLPFSQLENALDHEHQPTGGGPDTWARILVKALSDPAPQGAIPQLRAVAGEIPPVSSNPFGDGMGLAPDDDPNVLVHGLPLYYRALCRVMDAKMAIFTLLNGTPPVKPPRPEACIDPIIREILPMDGIQQTFLFDFLDLQAGFVTSATAEFTSSGNLPFGKMWAGLKNGFLGVKGAVRNGPPDIPFSSPQELASSGARGIGSFFKKQFFSPANSETRSKARQDRSVEEPPQPGSPFKLSSWAPHPVIAKKPGIHSMVEVMD